MLPRLLTQWATLKGELAGQSAHKPFGSIDVCVYRAFLESGRPRFEFEPKQLLLEFVNRPPRLRHYTSVDVNAAALSRPRA